MIRTNDLKRSYAIGSIIVLISTTTLFLIFRPSDYLIEKSLNNAESIKLFYSPQNIRAISEGINETAIVIDPPDMPPDVHVLYTNGYSMSGTYIVPQRYMRAFAHIPLLQIEHPEDALVICLGVGNTLQATTLHSDLKRIEIVDLSANILQQIDFFYKGLLRDNRISVFVNDGRQHLRMQKNNRYDLITLEPPPLPLAGVESLYTQEFYSLANDKLKDGGFISQWLPIKQLPGEISLALISAFIHVFPNSVLLSGELDELILMARKNRSIEFDPQLFQKHLAERPAVALDMKKYNMGTLLDVAGMFASDREHLRRSTESILPINDNDPQMEYSAIYIVNSLVPLKLYAETRLDQWCPRCFQENGSPISDLRDIQNYFHILHAVRMHKGHFLITHERMANALPLVLFGMSKTSYEHTLKQSTYLQLLSERWDTSPMSFVVEPPVSLQKKRPVNPQ